MTYRITREVRDDDECSWLSKWIDEHSPIWGLVDTAMVMTEEEGKHIARYIADTYGQDIICFPGDINPLTLLKEFQKEHGKRDGHRLYAENLGKYRYARKKRVNREELYYCKFIWQDYKPESWWSYNTNNPKTAAEAFAEYAFAEHRMFEHSNEWKGGFAIQVTVDPINDPENRAKLYTIDVEAHPVFIASMVITK